MWAFETRVSKQRNLSHFLKLFSIALPQNSEDQIAQDPRDVVPAELWSCKWRLRALVTSLSKDPHLHMSLAVLLIPAHVEDHQDTARGPTARAAGAEKPGKGLLLVLCPSRIQNTRKKVLVWCEGPFVPWFHLLNQLLEHLLPYFHVFFHHGCSVVATLRQGLQKSKLVVQSVCAQISLWVGGKLPA